MRRCRPPAPAPSAAPALRSCWCCTRASRRHAWGSTLCTCSWRPLSWLPGEELFEEAFSRRCKSSSSLVCAGRDSCPSVEVQHMSADASHAGLLCTVELRCPCSIAYSETRLLSAGTLPSVHTGWCSSESTDDHRFCKTRRGEGSTRTWRWSKFLLFSDCRRGLDVS